MYIAIIRRLIILQSKFSKCLQSHRFFILYFSYRSLLYGNITPKSNKLEGLISINSVITRSSNLSAILNKHSSLVLATSDDFEQKQMPNKECYKDFWHC